MSSSASLTTRVVELESIVTHLEHDLQRMHEVLLAQQQELEDLRRQLRRQEARVDDLQEDPEVRDPQAERPPHY